MGRADGWSRQSGGIGTGVPEGSEQGPKGATFTALSRRPAAHEGLCHVEHVVGTRHYTLALSALILVGYLFKVERHEGTFHALRSYSLLTRASYRCALSSAWESLFFSSSSSCPLSKLPNEHLSTPPPIPLTRPPFRPRPLIICERYSTRPPAGQPACTSRLLYMASSFDSRYDIHGGLVGLVTI